MTSSSFYYLDVVAIPIHACVKYIWPLLTTGLVPTSYFYSFIVITLFKQKYLKLDQVLGIKDEDHYL